MWMFSRILWRNTFKTCIFKGWFAIVGGYLAKKSAVRRYYTPNSINLLFIISRRRREIFFGDKILHTGKYPKNNTGTDCGFFCTEASESRFGGVRVPGTGCKPHNSKDWNFLHRIYTQLFFFNSKKFIFSHSKKKSFWKKYFFCIVFPKFWGIGTKKIHSLVDFGTIKKIAT